MHRICMLVVFILLFAPCAASKQCLSPFFSQATCFATMLPSSYLTFYQAAILSYHDIASLSVDWSCMSVCTSDWGAGPKRLKCSLHVLLQCADEAFDTGIASAKGIRFCMCVQAEEHMHQAAAVMSAVCMCL